MAMVAECGSPMVPEVVNAPGSSEDPLMNRCAVETRERSVLLLLDWDMVSRPLFPAGAPETLLSDLRLVKVEMISEGLAPQVGEIEGGLFTLELANTISGVPVQLLIRYVMAAARMLPPVVTVTVLPSEPFAVLVKT
jgi:hypothetical protein